MLNIKSLSILLKITSKLDLSPVVKVLKDADIFTDAEDKRKALEQLTSEKAGELAFTAVGALLPQLDVVGEFLPELAAAYKGVSVKEAESLDAFAVIEEIINDEGMRDFFRRAVRDKVKRKLAGS